MTIAYFDCFAGISGDMTLGALIDAGGRRDLLEETVKALHLADEVGIEVSHETRGHAGGTRVAVNVKERGARAVPALRAVLENAVLPEPVRRPALETIDRLARAESRVHRLPEDQLHLHELGGADTLVDVVGAFWLLHDLHVDQVYASQLPAPRGRKDGMPLPAPASLLVLEGTDAVMRAVEEDRELVTPTGAAILAVCARFTRPAMTLRSVGYGVGSRDVPGNVLAVWIGDEVSRESEVTIVETNIDDMPPNLIAALSEDLMAAGALDVSITPVLMKKGRPGHLLSVMSPPDLVAKLSDHLLRHSTTLGVRLSSADRIVAARRIIEVTTRFGTARAKVKELNGKMIDVTPEYEDCRRISHETGAELTEVVRAVADAARAELGQ